MQLYQVDVDRSYLLDFTSLAPEDDDDPINTATPITTTTTISTTPPTATTTTTTELLSPPRNNSGKIKNPTNENVHNVMEFFEMCSDLIVALAC